VIIYIGPHVSRMHDDQGQEWSTPTPPQLFFDIRFLLQSVMMRAAESTVILEDAYLGAIRPEAEAAGWTWRQPERSAWATLTKENVRINLVVPAWQDPTAHDPMVHRHAEPTFNRLSAWFDQTGTQYYLSPGVSTENNLLNEAKNSHLAPPVWSLANGNSVLHGWEPPARINSITFKAKGWRPGVAAHQWDMRRAFLNALGAVELPLAQLHHTGDKPTTSRCGYYRVFSPNPHPEWMFGKPDRQGTVWVTQSSLELIRRRSDHVDVVDSWTPVGKTDDEGEDRTGHRRLFRGWAEEWSRLLDKPNPLPAYKLGYAEMIGMWASRGGFIYRPDWRHMIIDHVRASIARRVAKVEAHTPGLWPARINTDAVYYKANGNPGPLAVGPMNELLGVGDRPGNMRYEGIDDGQG